MNQNDMENILKHNINTILAQTVTMHNQLREQKEKEDLTDAQKETMTSFVNHHLMVLSLILHDLADYAYENFPGAKEIIDWLEAMYKFGVDNGQIKLCACQVCKDKNPQVQSEKIEEKTEA